MSVQTVPRRGSRGFPERRKLYHQAPASPPHPVATGRREGNAVGADCPRCGGHHRYELELAVSVVACPRTGGRLVVVWTEGGVS